MKKLASKAQTFIAQPNQTFRQVYDSIQGPTKPETDDLRKHFIEHIAGLTFCSTNTVKAWLYNSDQQPNLFRKQAVAEYLQAESEHLFPTTDA